MPVIPPRAENGGAVVATSSHSSQAGIKQQQQQRSSQKFRVSTEEVLEMLRLERPPPVAPMAPPPSFPCPGEVPVDKSSTSEHKVVHMP
jgi:hypothetical protein